MTSIPGCLKISSNYILCEEVWISANGSRILYLSISFFAHSVIKSCFANLHDLYHIRHFLSFDVSNMGANGLFSSRLDCDNTPIHYLSSKNITRLQNIE